MILATESGEGESVDVKLVKVPDGAKIGEKAFIENEEDKKPEAYPKECKSKLWEQVKQTLLIKGGKATYLWEECGRRERIRDWPRQRRGRGVYQVTI